MIEETYNLYQGNDFKIEKLVLKKNGQYIHMVLPKDTGLPIHQANAELFMTVIRGTLTIGLNDLEKNTYYTGTMINIPHQSKMEVKNYHDEVLELIVVKINPEKVV
jgi:quercetin dioxygenase-like cupin family protein